jgi:ATP-binding cassette subfamily C (CFTR/MRP) protein 1
MKHPCLSLSDPRELLVYVGSVANCVVVLWLKWWAESEDTSDSGTRRNLYLFVAVTVINIVLYFIYMA